ncbi:MAG: TetR/AcrR family transcriptional regulator, partial [Tissierellia bacterium]|nr:TetR/AcrR family transcriptional regulator [Tissierellia bacterium]
MPQATFFNLPDDKKNLIIAAALDEFSSASYDTASINQICKKSNIAKGSFYQYFTDKMDLYVYIMTLAIEEKIKFFSSVLTEFDTLSLLEQFRLLFLKGIEFAKDYPQYAALGEQFSKENN